MQAVRLGRDNPTLLSEVKVESAGLLGEAVAPLRRRIHELELKVLQLESEIQGKGGVVAPEATARPADPETPGWSQALVFPE